MKMSERPTRIKPPTAKLTDANNTEPLLLSSHRDSVATHAQARAQTTPSSVATPSAVNNVNPAAASVNQPLPSVHIVPASPDIEAPTSNKRPLRATVTDEEEDSAEVLSGTTPAKPKKNRQKRARNEAGVFS